MIVCNGCGYGLSALSITCPRCSGRGIERQTPLRALLTPTQHRGSPDRWAQNYTTPPSGPIPRSSPYGETIDIPLSPDDGSLARVYGSVLDPNVKHPTCRLCRATIKPGAKLYLAPRDTIDCASQDVLCRSCYSVTFRIGICALCSLPILGEREEGGPHIIGRFGTLWHHKCFVCHHCSSPLAKADHLLLPSGSPSCVNCADMAEHQPVVSRFPRPDGYLPTRVVPPSPAFPSTMPRDSAIAIQANRIVVNDIATAAVGSRTTASLGTSNICPRCKIKVAPLERGTVTGPQGERWHQTCLRCGRDNPKQGCSKQLDERATILQGVPFCRLCALKRSA